MLLVFPNKISQGFLHHQTTYNKYSRFVAKNNHNAPTSKHGHNSNSLAFIFLCQIYVLCASIPHVLTVMNKKCTFVFRHIRTLDKRCTHTY